MNLVDQIFEQAKAGSANGAGLGQFFAQGVQQGQEQQRINQQSQELALKIAQVPLQQKLLEQDAAFKAAQTEGLLYNQQSKVQTQQALADLAGGLSKAWTETDGTMSVPMLLDALKTTPRLADTKEFWDLAKQNQVSLAAQNAKEYHEASLQERNASTEERRFKDKPNAVKFEELAKQAEAAGDPDTAAMYREHAGLELEKEARLQRQEEDVHQHNQIRLKQLEANISRTNNKAALDALQSQFRNIENAPRLKLAERNAKVSELLREYEQTYGAPAPSAPGAATTPAPAPTGGTNAFRIGRFLVTPKAK